MYFHFLGGDVFHCDRDHSDGGDVHHFHLAITGTVDPRPKDANEPDKFMFNHVFVAIKEGINSHHFEMLDPVLKKLGAYRIFRVKANLTVRTNEHEPSGFHVDGFDNSLTSIYYINTCNGYTEFKTGEKVKSVSNRMIIFDSELEHQGVTCTDNKRRVLINFNYNQE